MSALVWIRSNDSLIVQSVRQWIGGPILGVADVPGSDRLSIIDHGGGSFSVIDVVGRKVLAAGQTEGGAVRAAFGVLSMRLAEAQQVLKDCERFISGFVGDEVQGALPDKLIQRSRHARGVTS